jgi:hypothetical protein
VWRLTRPIRRERLGAAASAHDNNNTLHGGCQSLSTRNAPRHVLVAALVYQRPACFFVCQCKTLFVCGCAYTSSKTTTTTPTKQLVPDKRLSYDSPLRRERLQDSEIGWGFPEQVSREKGNQSEGIEQRLSPSSLSKVTLEAIQPRVETCVDCFKPNRMSSCMRRQLTTRLQNGPAPSHHVH